MRPEYSLDSLQYPQVIIDDENDVPILQDIPDLSAYTLGCTFVMWGSARATESPRR